ncbi:MAG TPA: phosphoribosylformylglycinamidine cyclo-ligase [Acidobacteriota bacterium]|nr:phosphoribosylformylglycinamidine cyclo-ligase [Acidobacteriota bacterium]
MSDDDQKQLQRQEAQSDEKPSETAPGGLTYASSGVDIDRANQAKGRIKELARSTFNEGVVHDIGSFAGLFRPDFSRYAKAVLVSSADGVGTKLKIAFMTGVHNTVGIDLVAHCANDILAQRARPLFFLDYIATGHLDPEVVVGVVEGLSQGCRQAGCVLLGGETAEMPDFYQEGEYDLAGFIVGMADEERLFRQEDVQAGDLLIGLPSSGLHTNGFSLVRRLCFKRLQLTPESYVAELKRPLGEELLEPHRCYLPVLDNLLDDADLHGLAHITGGGITENLDRALPSHLDARVDRESWEPPAIFRFIQERGRVDREEMFRTFNMGIGMVLIVASSEAERFRDALEQAGSDSLMLGEIVKGGGKVRYS